MSKKKHIWIINQYTGTPYYGMNYRSYYFAKEFVKNGYDVTIFSGSYSHLFSHYPKMNNTFEEEKIDGIRYIWVQTPYYKSSQSLGRIWSMFAFMYQLFKFNTNVLPKPDTIILSSLSLFPIINAYIWSKKYNAKLIFEVRDIWPLTLVELGGVSKYHPFVFFMGLFEKFAHKKADIIISPLQNYNIYLKKMNIQKRFYWISNGIDISEVQNKIELPRNIESQIPKNKFIIGYLGAFGKSNAIDFYLKAIELVPKELNISFLFVGDGEFRETIIEISKKDNRVILINKVEKSIAFEIMKRCTVLFKGNPNNKLYSYGISPIKLFEYMLASRPILHSTNVKNDIVEISNCGITVKSEDIYSIKKAIVDFYSLNKEKLDIIGKNGFNYVVFNHTYSNLSKRYIQLL